MCKRSACIIVLGDIGRSPRMEYHAACLLENDYNIDMIGYVDTPPLEILRKAQNNCKIHALSELPINHLPKILQLVFKTIWQTICLLITLIIIRKPNFLLIQNPPGIPTLFVSYLYCVLTRCKMIIDWHNYTYTILGLSVPGGEKSVINRIARWLERFFGAKANANFCVSQAMRRDLNDNWNISNVTVLYDRPADRFQPINLNRKFEILSKLFDYYPDSLSDFQIKMNDITIEIYVSSNDKKQFSDNKNVGILVSSTSWTADEDFGLLLKALLIYESEAYKHPSDFPYLLCIITGKGPQKEEYIKRIENTKWTKVTIVTPWLEDDDYPAILAAADLGVCLHYSSSGLDLPMKVLDMFGCGLPVCAYNFTCLDELVMTGYNGFTFNDHFELGKEIIFWFKQQPNNYNLLCYKNKFKKNLDMFQKLRWKENWTVHALPVLNSFI